MSINQPLKLGFDINSFQIESTSVSRYNSLQDCQLKGVLDAKGEEKLLAYSIDNVLGILIHELMEDSLYDDFPNTEEEIKNLFEEKIKSEELKLNDDDLLSPFLPLKRTKDFAIKKIKVIRNAMAEHKNSENNLLRRGHASSVNTNRALGPEVNLNIVDEDSNIRIKGKIDKVSKDETNQIVITDYKSGEVHDENGELKKFYKDQLEIYAAIYLKQFEKRPSRLRVENLKKKKEEWNFNENSSKKLYENCIQQIKDLNYKLISEDNDVLNEILCDTSESGCRFCPYKPKCKKFIKKIDCMTREQLIEEKNIYGKFIQVIPHEEDASINIVKIDSNGAEFSIWLREEEKHPDFKNLPEGAKIAFFNLRMNQGKFVEKASTRSYFYE